MTFCYGLIFYQVYDSFEELVTIGNRLRLPKDSSFFKLLDHHQTMINNKLIFAAIVSYIFSFTLTVKISHKVSGPLYRLKMFFLELKEEGFTKPLKFRKGDYYEELPDVINSGLRKVQQGNAVADNRQN